MVEAWRPVAGYEGLYEVSDHGRVRSLDRRVERRYGTTRLARGRILAHNTGSVGYPYVNLWYDGKGKVVLVHALVAEAFLGPRPPGHDVCHLDGTRTNNKVDNLSYGTRSENLRQAVEHGSNWNTAKTHCSNGHRFVSWNVNTDSKGRSRHCKSCNRERSSAYYYKRPFDKLQADQIFATLAAENNEEEK